MQVAVAGGSGLVGRMVVDELQRRGHQAVVLSRANGVDLTDAAATEAELVRRQQQSGGELAAVIDVSNVTTMKEAPAVDFFTTVTRNLVQAEQAAGVPHHVALSIVGIDGLSLGYYHGKLAQEALLESTPSVPAAGDTPGWGSTVLRASQFHEFAEQSISRFGLGPVCLVPPMPCQPVAASEVAEHLVTLAEQPPVGRAPDLVGPRPEEMSDMVRRLSKARGERRFVLSPKLPGAMFREMRAGLNPAPGFVRGAITFDEWAAASSH